MIRTLLIILLFAAIILSVVARSTGSPPYPTVFSAAINQTNYRKISGNGDWVVDRRIFNSIFYDAPNKRFRSSHLNDLNLEEDWILMYQIPGADPSSPNANGFTIINTNPAKITVPGNCWYSQTFCDFGCSAKPPLPDHWAQLNTSDIDMSSWYVIPEDMIHNGTYYIAELNVSSDRYDSKSICHMGGQIGDVPCTSIMYSKGQNPLPLMDVKSFVSTDKVLPSTYTVRVYHQLKTSVIDSDFVLPTKWQTKCVNVENTLQIQWPTTPGTSDPGYPTVYNDNTSQFMVSLTTPPLKSLGPVTVYVNIDPSYYLWCLDCLQDVYIQRKLTFTHDDWNVPQIIPLIYRKNGCSQVSFSAEGGGYGLVGKRQDVPVLTCTNGSGTKCRIADYCTSPAPGTAQF